MKRSRLLFLFFVSFSFIYTPSFGQMENNPFLQSTTNGQLALTADGASHFARLALDLSLIHI